MDRTRVLVAVALLAALPSCSEVIFPEAASGSGTGSGGNGGNGGAGPTSSTGTGAGGGIGGGMPVECGLRAMFEATVQGELVAQCGACHQSNVDGAALIGPDVYASVASYPSVLTADPNASILFHAGSSDHGAGQAPGMSSALESHVLAWLAEEAQHMPSAVSQPPALAPVKPRPNGGTTAVPLDALGPSFVGSSLSFVGSSVDDPPSLLDLTDFRLLTAPNSALHMAHPRFTIHPPCGGSAPDPIDALAGVDQIVPPGSSLPIASGNATVGAWVRDAWLEIAFDELDEALTGGSGPCKDLAGFIVDVVPQMKACADTCHAGSNAQATAAMSLVGLEDPVPNAACAAVRARIVPGDPLSSQVVIVTDPTQQAFHLFKFGGNKNKHKAFVDAISPWILAEL